MFSLGITNAEKTDVHNYYSLLLHNPLSNVPLYTWYGVKDHDFIPLSRSYFKRVIQYYKGKVKELELKEIEENVSRILVLRK